MVTLNVLLPSLPWKHCRNISGCNKNGRSICINVKKNRLLENFKVHSLVKDFKKCMFS